MVLRHCERSEGRNFSESVKTWIQRRIPETVGKKKRNRELTIIPQNVEASTGILQSNFTNNVTSQSRNETWKAITEKVNAVGVASRTIYEVKQKWKGCSTWPTRNSANKKA